MSARQGEAQNNAMKEKRICGTALFKALRTYPKPSRYIPSIDDFAPGTLVVLYGRCSRRSQKNNLLHQLENMKRELEKRGLIVIAVYWEIVPGWERADSERWGRHALDCAIAKARHANAVVVTESVDRFRRSYRRDWKPGQPQPPLNALDLKWLMDEAAGVRLATLLHPDTPPDEVRSEQTKRGQTGKGNYGGRPVEQFPKKAKRLKLKPLALWLWGEGVSYRQIADELDAPFTTVHGSIRPEKSVHSANDPQSRFGR